MDIVIEKSTLIKERQELFDDDFNHKTSDLSRILNFCQFLKDVTGIQVCSITGGTYEYLPQVYNSVLSKLP